MYVRMYVYTYVRIYVLYIYTLPVSLLTNGAQASLCELHTVLCPAQGAWPTVWD